MKFQRYLFWKYFFVKKTVYNFLSFCCEHAICYELMRLFFTTFFSIMLSAVTPFVVNLYIHEHFSCQKKFRISGNFSFRSVMEYSEYSASIYITQKHNIFIYSTYLYVMNLSSFHKNHFSCCESYIFSQ